MNRSLLLLAAVALLGGGACAALKGGATGDYEQGAAPAPQFAKDSEVCAKLAGRSEGVRRRRRNRLHPCDLQPDVRRLHAGKRLSAQAGAVITYRYLRRHDKGCTAAATPSDALR